MTLGQKLRAIRKAQNKTLRQVNADTGISYSNLAQIERGEHQGSGSLLKTLAEYYGVSIDYLIGNTVTIPVADSDGSLTEVQHQLLDATKGLTTEDLIEVNKYIEFLKSKKG